MMSIDFDKKLAELDAYLQMLIVENESLEKKLTLTTNDSESSSLKTIQSDLDALLESIKHAIILLQIAKVSIRSSSSAESTPPTPPPPPPRARHSNSSTPTGKDIGRKHAGSTKASNLTASHEQSQSGGQSLQHRSSKEEEEEEQRLRRQQQQQQPPQLSPQPLSLQKESLSPASLPQSSRGKAAGAVTAAFKKAASNVTATNCVSTDAVPGTVGSHVNVDPIRGTPDRLDRDDYGGNVGGSNDGDADNDNDDDDDDDDAFFDAADEHLNRSSTTATNQTGVPSAKASNQSDTLVIKNSAQDKKDQRQQHTTNLQQQATSQQELTQMLSKAEESGPGSSQGASGIVTNSASNNNNNNISNAIGDGNIDWDALYEDEDEDDLGSLEGEGSVIKHLLSQIRIGMDLTKVVLPTFILERRSLLEMYADFFAHPDLFSSIPDYNTKEERMVQLVRWYLSAFHAGRKSSVAKKPYNPILGELFRCSWNLDNNNNSNSSATTDNGDQTTNDCRTYNGKSLLFVAEQVSHHPPVSAFYAENKEKDISCCAHIYTKSKYLGLSVGVHNVGQGVIELGKHNETYVCTFPSAFGRSILTVPWVELGGSVTINCQQTGYSANIEFVTKPFYGGKKHRVMGEILRPNKEPFLTIDGEWNGVMYCKTPPNMSEKKTFVDTTTLPVIKKHVESVNCQHSYESRNVWKEVTRALKMRDVASATAAKSFIEQRQRDLLKDRLEKGLKWKTRYFEACDDGWRYAHPESSPADEMDQL